MTASLQKHFIAVDTINAPRSMRVRGSFGLTDVTA
jgi:hypothetical protein